MLHSSVLYVLQLVGRAQGNFHTPPIVVVLQTPLSHLSVVTRCRRRALLSVEGHRERAAWTTAVHCREKKVSN